MGVVAVVLFLMSPVFLNSSSPWCSGSSKGRWVFGDRHRLLLFQPRLFPCSLLLSILPHLHLLAEFNIKTSPVGCLDTVLWPIRCCFLQGLQRLLNRDSLSSWEMWCSPLHTKGFYALHKTSSVNINSVCTQAEGHNTFVNSSHQKQCFFKACFLLLFCRIKHENIVALEDIYESSNYLYLIMQL